MGMDKDTMLTKASHIPMLAAVALHTVGPILEYGCGFYSTPLLHEIALVKKRQLLSLDNCWMWLNQFLYLQNDNHTFRYVRDWDRFTKSIRQNWGVIFIDHGPTLRRKEDIRLLKNRAEYMVVHDANVKDYKYEEVFDLFEHRYDYIFAEPWTTVLSNKHTLDFLERIPC